MLRDSPQLEELFLCLGIGNVGNALPSAEPIPTRVSLHALQRLYIRDTPAALVYQLLGSVDFITNEIAMQFTNITSGFTWTFPTTLPLEPSLRAATSFEIIYTSGHGMIIQGNNQRVRIRVAHFLDSKVNHTEIFSDLARQASPQFPLRELWIHIERKKEYKLPPLSQFSHLEKLVVRVTTDGNPVRRLLQMLGVNGDASCPLLSTLTLLGVLSIDVLSKVLKTRSNAGYRLGRLRLGKSRILLEEAAM